MSLPKLWCPSFQMAAADEIDALKNYCSLEKELKEFQATNAATMRTLSEARAESMHALLNMMQEADLDCVAIDDDELKEEARYIRVVQAQSTRELTNSFVRNVLHEHLETIVSTVEGAPGERLQLLQQFIWDVVKQQRTTSKPVVMFAKSRQKGLERKTIVPLSATQLLPHVKQLHQARQQYEEATQSSRSVKTQLEESKASYYATVQAFLKRKNTDSQKVIMNGTEEVFLKKKVSKQTQPLTIAQFRDAVSRAVAAVFEGCADEALTDALREKQDDLVNKIEEQMSAMRLTYQREVITLDKPRGKKKKET
jgi:hypothetical protein